MEFKITVRMASGDVGVVDHVPTHATIEAMKDLAPHLTSLKPGEKIEIERVK